MGSNEGGTPKTRPRATMGPARRPSAGVPGEGQRSPEEQGSLLWGVGHTGGVSCVETDGHAGGGSLG